MNSIVYQPDAVDHLVSARAHFVQFVSEVLPPQSIPAQPIKLQLRAAEDQANNNLFVAWKLYAVAESGASVLGTLAAIRSDATEVGIVLTNRSDSTTSTLFTSTQNFRLVIELGLSGTPAATTGVQGHNGTLSFGEAGATDLPEDDTATGALNPWLQFTQNLTFGVSQSNLLLNATDICAGGEHVHVSAQVNSGTVYIFAYTASEVVEPIPEDVIRDTVLGIMRLRFSGRTGGQAKTELQAGFTVTI